MRVGYWRVLKMRYAILATVSPIQRSFPKTTTP